MLHIVYYELSFMSASTPQVPSLLHSKQTITSIPPNTRRNTNVIMTSKRRHFDVIMTLLLRHVYVVKNIITPTSHLPTN